MSGKRFIVLEVEEARADELIAILSKRAYLSVLKMDRDDRRRLEECPACLRQFSEEKSVPIHAKLVEKLVGIAETMKIARSVLLCNTKNPSSSISSHEKPRCLEMDQASIDFAVYSGLLCEYQDGRYKAHYLTSKALRYLDGDPISPSRVVFVDGNPVDCDQSTTSISRLKFKDKVAHDKLMARAKRAVAELPSSAREFIENGQVSILI